MVEVDIKRTTIDPKFQIKWLRLSCGWGGLIMPISLLNIMTPFRKARRKKKQKENQNNIHCVVNSISFKNIKVVPDV